MGKTAEAKPAANRFARYLPIAILLAVLLIGLLLGWHRYLTLDYLAEVRLTLLAFTADNGVVAALLYVAIYTAAVAVAFPATWVLTVIGGFLYGAFLGTALAAIGATAGATILFWAAKTALGDALRKRAGGYAERAAKGFERNAFSYLLALRFLPVIPYAVVNVLPAMFNVPVGTYVAATLIGILPAVFVYASIGQGLETSLGSAAEAGRSLGLGDLVTPALTWGLLGLAILAVLPPIIGFVRRRRAAR